MYRHAAKVVERYCEPTGEETAALRVAQSLCMDDQVKPCQKTADAKANPTRSGSRQ